MLKGQPKNGIRFDYLVNALFNQEESHQMRSRPNVYKQDHPNSHEGWEEEHLVGFCTTAFQKTKCYLCQQGLRNSYWRQETYFALTWPFLGFSERSECSRWERCVVQVGAPAGWAPPWVHRRTVGMGWARRAPQFLPHQPSAGCSSEPSWPGGCCILADRGAGCHLGSCCEWGPV